jgi:hypothetical protein
VKTGNQSFFHVSAYKLDSCIFSYQLINLGLEEKESEIVFIIYPSRVKQTE